MACWFSATAIIPELTRDWDLTQSQASWLTNAVQLGFVLGALASSLVNLPDLMPLPRLITVSACGAALANAVLLIEPGWTAALIARFVTGMALAGIYPPAMKLMATWFSRGRGLAMGVLIGALTLGSSMPHLFRAASEGLDWRMVVILSSLGAALSAAIFGFLVREGPHAFGRAVFDPRRALVIFRNRGVLLANLGYFGHMWELYAMWAWFLAFATAAERGGVGPFGSPSLFAFLVVASGAVGCVLGGLLSDRIGRCLTTAGMMAVSGACALLIGFAFDGPAWLLAFVAVIWGISIVGDSAQFSAAVTELADPRFVGTALTLQVSIGFALTVLTIWIMPHIAAALGGWRWAFLVLLPGPVVGAWAMLRLRGLPEARKLAGGKG
ncbi:Predicted arabinose efflux permease, MFS family [Paracoccus saliphilus]|uniref:MFS transporter n=2 Tax=Paracoccus saliphilus TaxID=405559 RepID=A0AA45W1U8_9RHOB|nr:MFS transporter [Paracoccus saliphilus]SIS62530.1 Predicted arabinose efflux permease, MFS family [Paracoccus saliphilus]